MTEQGLITGTETRTLAAIGSEIREHAARMEYHMKGTIWEAVEIGRRLTEARDLAEHGEWMDFLKQETPFSYKKANNLIRVFEAYGEQQKSLFGTEVSNWQTYANLSFSQALELLALPAGEREEFTAEKNVEDMSVRELREAIRERDEARKALEEEKQASEGAALRIAELEDTLDQSREELDQAQRNAAKAEMDACTAEKSRTEMEKEMQFLKGVHEGTLKELEELRNRPVDVAVEVDSAAVEAARAEVREEMRKAIEDRETQVSKLQKAQDSLRTSSQNKIMAQGEEINRLKAELKEAKEQLKKAEKAAQKPSKTATESVIAGDGDLETFNDCFNEVQTVVNRMRGILLKVRGKDPEEAGKLEKAVLALADAVKGVTAA